MSEMVFQAQRGPDGSLWGLSFRSDLPGLEGVVDLGLVLPNIIDIEPVTDGTVPMVHITAYGELVEVD